MRKESEIVDSLADLLNECLETANQEDSFEILSFDKDRMKLIVEFNVVSIEDDDYIAFQGIKWVSLKKEGLFHQVIK